MKISELIKQLNKIKKSHGDLSVYLIESETGDYIDMNSILKIWPRNSMGCADFTKRINGIQLCKRNEKDFEDRYMSHLLFK